MGAICANSRYESTKHRAALAAIYEESANLSHGDLPAVSSGSLERVEAAAIVFSLGHDCFVESFLHDSPVGGVLWAGNSVVVASVRT